ncbi:MAG TPA: ATP synthase subunit C [Bacillota bacterium]|nr:ATP synthase subunit C [Bacillota bacterium]HPL54870.1 ATP synthase subunit C [Bacillota bacterium]
MQIILGIAVGIVVFTIGLGIIIYRTKGEMNKRKIRNILGINIASYVFLITLFLFILVPDIVHAAQEGSSASGMGFIAAGLSTGLATIGAGYAVGAVGSSALGAVSEDPRILGKTLIFVGLAEGIAIYGLIVSIMILGRF